jgi:NitT/TauT family transport system permease protein
MAKNNKGSFLQGLLVPIIVIALWEASRAGWINPQILPSPWAVLKKWVNTHAAEAYDPGRQLAGLGLLRRTDHGCHQQPVPRGGGFLIGAGLALPLGWLMGSSQRIYGLMNLTVQVIRPIPPIAYIPLAILWFGLGNPPALFLISLGAFFPVLMNTIAGVRQVDSIYLRAARNLGASQSTLPAGDAAGGGALHPVRRAHRHRHRLHRGDRGRDDCGEQWPGFRIMEAREYFWSDKIIAGMITIGLLGLAIDLGMSRL